MTAVRSHQVGLRHLQDEVFGDPVTPEAGDALLRRLARDDGMESWVAEAGGRMVSAGRLEPVAGTDVAGVWGRPGRGVDDNPYERLAGSTHGGQDVGIEIP